MKLRNSSKFFGALSILAVFLLSAPLAFAATMQANRPWATLSGLVGYWSFNGPDVTDKVYDRSGQGNNGYFIGGATSSAKTIGKVGQALTFDGTTNYIDMGDVNAVDGLTTITASAWIRTSTPGSVEHLVMSKTGCVDAPNAGVFELGGIPGDGTLGFAIFKNGGTPNLYSISGATPINNGVWHMVTGTYDGANLNFYVDGVLDAAPVAAAGITMPSTADPLRIGSCSGGGFGPWDGLIDEARIYNRALSAAEVRALYRAGQVTVAKTLPTGVKNGLVGQWTFDGSDFTDKVYDVSGQGNNGYVIGAATSSVKAPGKVGQGINFAGLSSYINLGNPTSLQLAGTHTLSAWVKANSFNDQDIISKGMNPGGGGNGFSYIMNANTDLGSPLFSCTTSADGNTDTATRYSNSPPVTGRWYLVSCVYNSTLQTLNIYVNGQLDNGTLAGTVSGTLFNSTDPASISHRFNNAFYWDGLIDDARVYNRALSAAEVKQIYNEGGGVTVGKSQTSLIPNGLVGYWSFNGPDFTDAVYDRSGQGNHGGVIGIATTSVKTAGRIGQGVKFNRVAGQYLGMGDPTTYDGLSQFSASAWIKTSVGDQEMHIFDKSACDGNSNGGPFELFVINQNAGFGLYPNGGVPAWYYGVTSATTVTDGRWHFLTGTYDGSTMRVYVDGVESGTPTTAAFTLSTNIRNVEIGGNCNTSTTCTSGVCNFNGSIDEVRAYNRALSAAEVKILYNSGR